MVRRVEGPRKMCDDPNCPYCEKCPHCGHMADEHMAGDFEAGICFICQRDGIDNCHEKKTDD